MFRMRMTWLASVVAMALLAVMMLSVGGTAAKTPGWQFIDAWTGNPVTAPCPASPGSCKPFTTSPTEVGPGKLAAFNVEIKNTGKSNISALYLQTDIPVSNTAGNFVYAFPAEWVGQSGPSAPCRADTSQPLYCNLGTLNAGSTVTLKIVLRAPAATLAFNFTSTGNGNTPSDSAGTSHGDTLKGPAAFTVNGSDEFDGGFTLDSGGTFDTGGTLGKNNPQQSTLVTTQSFLAATIQDGLTPSTNPCTSTCIGQWTKVTAPNPDNGLIKVVLLVYGKGIPGSVTADEIFVYHVGATGDEAIIGNQPFERCTTAEPCATANSTIYVEPDGQNFRITLWLLHNGSLRGSW